MDKGRIPTICTRQSLPGFCWDRCDDVRLHFLDLSWRGVQSLRYVSYRLTHLTAVRKVSGAFLFRRGWYAQTSHVKLQL